MPPQLSNLEPPSELDRLRKSLGIDLPNIDGARSKARAFRQRVESGIHGLTSEDTRVVLFG
jgi:hypothetical protein